jgi:hypothetical protein
MEYPTTVFYSSCLVTLSYRRALQIYRVLLLLKPLTFIYTLNRPKAIL